MLFAKGRNHGEFISFALADNMTRQRRELKALIKTIFHDIDFNDLVEGKNPQVHRPDEGIANLTASCPDLPAGQNICLPNKHGRPLVYKIHQGTFHRLTVGYRHKELQQQLKCTPQLALDRLLGKEDNDKCKICLHMDKSSIQHRVNWHNPELGRGKDYQGVAHLGVW